MFVFLIVFHVFIFEKEIKNVRSGDGIKKRRERKYEMKRRKEKKMEKKETDVL